MKNIFFILALISTTAWLNAQVGIERTEEPLVRGSGLLDFYGNGSTLLANKGILLPRVNNTSDIQTVGGAMALNLNSGNVEFYNPGMNAWVPLTKTAANNLVGNEHAGTPNTYSETAENAGVAISDGTGDTTVPDGVLALESSQRALILPQVADATQLASPKAGLICYDMASQSIAVFNGTEWSFWN